MGVSFALNLVQLARRTFRVLLITKSDYFQSEAVMDY